LEGFGEPVGPTIHQRASFVDALSSGQWIGDYASGSDAGNDIAALADAVRKVRIK
jgi:IS30 family transposase